MIIQPTTIAAQVWAGAAASSVGEALRLGAVMQAQSLGLNDEGLLVLQIAGMTVEADATSVPLPSQFTVRVASNGPLPQLEVVLDAAEDQVLMQALRDRLPQQAGYAPLLGTLDALSRRPAARNLPPELRTALANLEQAIPTPDELSLPDKLQQAIARSGLFFESTLLDEARQQDGSAPLNSGPPAGSPTGTPAGTPQGAGANAGPAPSFGQALGQSLGRSLGQLLGQGPGTTGTPGRQADTPVQRPAPLPLPGGSAAPADGDDWKAALLKVVAALARQPMPGNRVTAQDAQEVPPPLRQRALLTQARMVVDAETDVDSLVEHLRTNVRGAVARLEVSQLESQPQANAWMLELPVRGVRGYDVLQLKMEREPNTAGESSSDSWTLGFTIDVPSLGPLQGDIHLRGLRATVRVYAQFEPAVRQLEAQSPKLHRLIEEAGMQVEHLAIVQGLPQVASQRSAVFLQAMA
ncbi:flagellar hook-length control protein FliK [Pinirhizobacter sp.]|uniref:flagellar hook-length control protein FliK n=1 Tax=Pinirhizobacter sp. TaxID=2950432 RepID=UPI002F3E450E